MKDKTSLGPFLPEMYEKQANKTFVRQFYSSVGRQIRKDNLVKLQIGVLKRVALGTTTRGSKCVVWPSPQWDLREEVPISVVGSLDLLFVVPFRVLPQS